ncbi:MAG: ComF family protein [Deltaproteobacteria bacterium]|nr:ComF family protein [Deltaproteobacteria bacterium]
MLSRVLDFIYPPTCAVCSGALKSSNTKPLLCTQCDPARRATPCNLVSRKLPVASNIANLHDALHSCLRCGEPSPPNYQKNPICVACEVWPPPLRYVRSLWYYENQAENCIKAFKYGNKHRLANYFANQLLAALCGSEHYLPIFADANINDISAVQSVWDLMLPLPSSHSSTRMRGYAHMAFITRILSRNLGVSASLEALYSPTNRLAQAKLGYKERFQNAKSAFAARGKVVKGKKIVLIDDVMTTGASLWSAAWCLLDAGAISVDALTISRSKHFGSLRLNSARQHIAESFVA